MITIRDVARQAGVSVATVSRVLNQSSAVTSDTRDAVLQAVEALGYRPNANAQALATQVSDTIGVVVMDVSDPFFGALVKAVDTVAQRVHKHVLISNSWHQEEKERHAIEVLIRQRCSALVVHAKTLPDAELADFMRHVPGMVVINRIVPGFEHRSVSLDNVTGALMASRKPCYSRGIAALATFVQAIPSKMWRSAVKGGFRRWQSRASGPRRAG